MLAAILVPVLIFTLFFYRVNSTLANPDFYSRQLRQADVYNYFYASVLPAIVDAAEGPNLDMWKPSILKITKEAVPPQWLQTQTEQFIQAMLPYLTGNSQSFRVVIPLKDRMQALGASLKSTISQGDVASQVYGQVILTMLGQAPGNTNLLPFSVPVNAGDIVAKTAPPDWLIGQLSAAIDSALPYFTGDKEHFAVNIGLSDRMDSLQAMVTDVFKTSEAYDFVSKQLMVQAVRQNLTQLPLSATMTITDADTTALVNQAFPLDWYQTRVPDIVGQMFAYLRGTHPTPELTILIAERKPAIVAAGVKLLDQKLEGQYNSLPVCTPAQMDSLLANPPKNGLPPCRPAGVSYAQMKALTGVDLASAASPLLATLVPDQFQFADQRLAASLVQLKDLLQKGFTYSDQDLAKSVGAASLQTARQTISTGFVFTDNDLRSRLGSESVDTLRAKVGAFRAARFYVWMIPLLLLTAIGFLGGRRLGSRLAWAGGVLAGGAALAMIVFGPVFAGLTQPAINGALAQMMQQSDRLGLLISTKLGAIAQSSLDSFASGLGVQSLILLVIGLATVAGGVLLDVRRKRAAV